MIASSPRTRWSPPVPRWAKVAEAIREQIRAGHLAAGARLPSTAALATRYGVSATPVQKALTVLKTQGLLEGVTGVGVFVTATAPARLRRARTADGTGADLPGHLPLPRKPDYQRIYDDIRDRIERGDWGPDHRLPALRLLAQQYKVSLQPVKAALKMLERDGLVEGQQGKAVFVTGRPAG